MRFNKYLLLVALCLIFFAGPVLAYEFSEDEWKKDGRDVIRLENFSKNMRSEIRQEGAKLGDATRISSDGHEFVNSMVDKYARLRRHFDGIRVKYEDGYFPHSSGKELKQSIKATALWLAATAALIENAAAMTESFSGSVYEWRLNRPVLGKGDIQIAYMFEDMSDVLVSIRTRNQVRERLALFSNQMGPLNEVIIEDEGVLEELLRVITASDEIAEDSRLSLMEKVSKRIDRTLSHIHTWLSGRFIKRMNGLFNFLEGDPYKDEPADKKHKKDLGQEVHDEMLALLEPGDILVEKKTGTVPDLMIPGYWGHTAMWLGSDAYLDSIGAYKHSQNPISCFEAQEHREYIKKGRSLLEAVFTGVNVSTLRHFTYCDSAAVFRLKDKFIPQGKTREQAIAKIVKRGLYHAGQDYDFWFNVNSHNRIVCSELVYQAYPENINWPTVKLLNRPTISPDNVAAMAGPLDEFPFEVVFFIQKGDKHRGPDAWKAFWKTLKAEGKPFEAGNSSHFWLKEAIDSLPFD